MGDFLFTRNAVVRSWRLFFGLISSEPGEQEKPRCWQLCFHSHWAAFMLAGCVMCACMRVVRAGGVMYFMHLDFESWSWEDGASWVQCCCFSSFQHSPEKSEPQYSCFPGHFPDRTIPNQPALTPWASILFSAGKQERIKTQKHQTRVEINPKTTKQRVREWFTCREPKTLTCHMPRHQRLQAASTTHNKRLCQPNVRCGCTTERWIT